MNMKTFFYTTVFFALLLALNACQKSSPQEKQLIASSSVIKIGQTDSLELMNASASDNITWRVTPSGSEVIHPSGSHALLSFNKSGSYLVIVTLSDGETFGHYIVVTNDAANPNLSLAGDQITLLANYYKSKVTDTTYLTFTGVTSNKYTCSNSIINFTYGLDASNNFNINFIDVIQPSQIDCIAGNSSLATPLIRFWQNKDHPYMVPGVYALTVHMGGITYNGSITVTATDITINWPYTSGILITPLHFLR
ncbi:hypothetical protein BEL04_00985 [Mucilaginibacter sp. PPCGB 2223]|uniref:hypothetical protein n=1 Tax=Mucilaginibacter sp. PPCGB 2223 TaxID=1886027 RepID=UPI0008241E20|nr:hypothetical protein [Mucilaginibacter sp. PPCGB 2223]OCX52934.1 hypothetical protein BEL04_00985 [Mucilaginibacter sp. PPCGB 2223]